MKRIVLQKWILPIIMLVLVSCVDSNVPDGGGTTIVVNGKGYDPVLKSSATKNNKTGILLSDQMEFRGDKTSTYAYIILSNSLVGKTIDLSTYQKNDTEYFSVEINNERDTNGYLFVSSYDVTQASGTMTITQLNPSQYKVEITMQSTEGVKTKVTYSGHLTDPWPSAASDL